MTDNFDIKKIRKKLNMTQREFADIIGVSINTILNWEKGKVIPKSKYPILYKIGAQNGVLINGDNNSNIDNRQYYSDSPDVLKAQIAEIDRLLQEKEERIKEKDAQIKEKDAQIKELLSILKTTNSHV